MASVFPQVETWQTDRGDLVLLGDGAAARLQRRRAARAHRRGAVQDRARATRGAPSTSTGCSRTIVATDALARALRRRAARRDQHRRSQRRRVRPRAIGRPRRIEPARRAPRARARDGRVAPAARQRRRHRVAGVDTAWATRSSDGTRRRRCMPRIRRRSSSGRTALRRYYRGRRPGRRARDLARQQSEPPRDPSELAMAADLEAEAGSDTALPLIEQLRGLPAGRGRHHPGDAAAAPVPVRRKRPRRSKAAFARLPRRPVAAAAVQAEGAQPRDALGRARSRPRARGSVRRAAAAVQRARASTTMRLIDVGRPRGAIRFRAARAASRSARWSRTCRGSRRSCPCGATATRPTTIRGSPPRRAISTTSSRTSRSRSRRLVSGDRYRHPLADSHMRARVGTRILLALFVLALVGATTVLVTVTRRLHASGGLHARYWTGTALKAAVPCWRPSTRTSPASFCNAARGR